MATELEGLLLGAGSTSFSSQAPSAMFHQHRAALGVPSQSPYAGRALEVPGKDKQTHKTNQHQHASLSSHIPIKYLFQEINL